MKKLLFLTAFLLGMAAQAQTNFYTSLQFTDQAIANHPLTLEVFGYWDSVATTNYGPYTQSIVTNTNGSGFSLDSISVPANILDIRVRYTYSDCLNRSLNSGYSTVITAGNNPSFSALYCNTTGICNYSFAVTQDSSVTSGLGVIGQVIYGTLNSRVDVTWYGLGSNGTQVGSTANGVFNNAGTYTVVVDLTVKDVNGNFVCYAGDTILVTVPFSTAPNCDANFTISKSGLNLTVNGASNAGSHYYYLDNTSYQTQNFTHTFSAPGTYQIYAENNRNTAGGSCSDTIIKTVTVSSPTFRVYGSVNNITINDTAQVYLIQSTFDSITNNTVLSLVTTALSDSGSYYFSGLASGTYYLKAALTPGSPSYANTLPTYYGDVLMWNNATAFSVGPNQFNLDINMILGTNPGGPGFISGSVQQGANKVMAGGPWDVYLTTNQDVPVAYQRTDGNNSYNFSNLAYGTYKVFVEIPGSVVSPHIITLSGTNPGATNISFGADSLATGPLSLSADAQLGATLFPNPAKEKVTIEVNTASAEALSISIYAANGAEVLAKTLESGQNNQTLELNVRAWDKGLYIIKITQEENITFKKLQKL